MTTGGKQQERDADASPKVSVVMPVHNAMPYLDQAIESILAQTMKDFEFVILDDASSDGSSERLREWAKRDGRIRLLHSETNLGPVGSSNMVARAARAPFVARMDADDVSHPERLAEQLQLIARCEDAGVVASLCDLIDTSGRKIRASEPWRLHQRSAFVPFAHGAMMYRRKVFDSVGGYRDASVYWEDQDLVIRMSEISSVLIIPKAHYSVRISTNSTRALCGCDRLERALEEEFRTVDEMRGMAPPLSHPEGAAHRVDPRVFISLGSISLWAGQRPQLFWRMLKRGRLGMNTRTATALVWAAWAAASPSTLRRSLLLFSAVRNKLAARFADNSHIFRWRPFQGVEDVGMNEVSA